MEAKFRQELFRCLGDGNTENRSAETTVLLGPKDSCASSICKRRAPLRFRYEGEEDTEQPGGGRQEGGISWGTWFLCVNHGCTQS